MISLSIIQTDRSKELQMATDPKQRSVWLEIFKDEISIGVFQLQEITKITFNIHIHIFEEYQKKGFAFKCLDPLLTRLKHLKIKKLMCTVSKNNRVMRRVLSRTPFKLCGSIKDGIIWNDELTDLLIFELNIGN